jgi:hypothetical protein
MLCAALACRAAENAGARHPGYASLTAKWRRSLGIVQLLAAGLASPGALRDSILADADFQRLVALVKELDADFPQNRGPLQWALLSSADPAAAAQIAEFAAGDEVGRLSREIEQRLAPQTPDRELSRYREAQMAGDTVRADAARQSLAELGFELPAP